MSALLALFASHRKAIVALIGTVATWAVATFPSGTVTMYVALAMSGLTSLGVYTVPNVPATPAVPESGVPEGYPTTSGGV